MLTSLVAIAAIAAIVAELAIVKDLSGTIKGLRIGLAAATIVRAWFFIHLTYANISSLAIRRVALVHCVLAFFFNSAVFALTINIAAGLI